MKIKCVRCGKELDSPNASNAKYILKHNDSKTFGITRIEKTINAPLTKSRVVEIMKDKKMIVTEEEYESKLADFAKKAEVFSDSKGRREVVIEEEVEVPKTAIICLDCVQEDDTIIW